jgi:hypothetical protein
LCVTIGARRHRPVVHGTGLVQVVRVHRVLAVRHEAEDVLVPEQGRPSADEGGVEPLQGAGGTAGRPAADGAERQPGRRLLDERVKKCRWVLSRMPRRS